MSDPKIYLSPPHMTSRERELLLEAIDSGWVAPLGPHVDGFEADMVKKTGIPHAVALSSGTAALHLALHALRVGRGDDILVQSLTFVASANAVAYTGARPVFVDSDATSWNLCPDLLEEELRKRAKAGTLPKAVLTVDLYGQCANYKRIVPICEEYEVPLIEDAAEGLGATYQGLPAGSFGRFAAFSFNGNKIITCGGGGMLVTRDEEAARYIRFLATQAREPVAHYEHKEIGFNYRLSNLLAAVGRAQLSRLDDIVQRRRQVNRWYREKLGAIDGFDFMPEIEGGESTFWLSAATIDPTRVGFDRDKVIRRLQSRNIEARPLWKPMHMQPAFLDCPHVGGTVSQALFGQGLCLPSGTALEEHDVTRICDIILHG